jgi:hypothetical protein
VREGYLTAVRRRPVGFSVSRTARKLAISRPARDDYLAILGAWGTPTRPGPAASAQNAHHGGSPRHDEPGGAARCVARVSSRSRTAAAISVTSKCSRTRSQTLARFAPDAPCSARARKQRQGVVEPEELDQAARIDGAVLKRSPDVFEGARLAALAPLRAHPTRKG